LVERVHDGVIRSNADAHATRYPRAQPRNVHALDRNYTEHGEKREQD
jgi:hypothetical protein